MEHADTVQLSAVAGAIGAVVLLLSRGRIALLCGLAVVVAAEVAMALAVSTGSVDDVLSPAGVAAGAAGVGVLAGAAALLVRRPALVPIAVLVAAPLRPPVDFDASNRFLLAVAEDGQLGRLLPLYFVLAAAAVALAWRALRGAEMRELPRAVAWPAAAFFAWAFLSPLWAEDLESAANLLVFFTLPFAVLLAAVARAPFPDWAPRALGAAAVVLAALFAAVGLWQAITHELFFFAPNLQVSNANTDYFRVTSLFGDPSLYGRHVVLGLAVVMVALACDRVNRGLAAALVAVLFGGLLFSYSQSSMVALVVVTLAIATATGGRPVRRAVGVAVAVAALAGAGYVTARLVSGGSLNQITSDRTDRVEDTVRVVKEHPVVGVGIGNQARASRRLAGSDRPTPNFVSHTTPVTVAAELGAVGLALYVWLLAGGARLIESVRRIHEPLGLALGASFLALFVHALFYSGFLEDPVTWLVLAIAAGYAGWGRDAERARRRVRAHAEAEAAAAGR
jgi:hypothetical protein